MTTLVEYVNTSGFYGGGWIPQITGYDTQNNEYILELDLYEDATYNWEVFKKKYTMLNSKRFYREFESVLRETIRMSKITR